jgi:hypothetical protein
VQYGVDDGVDIGVIDGVIDGVTNGVDDGVDIGVIVKGVIEDVNDMAKGRLDRVKGNAGNLLCSPCPFFSFLWTGIMLM